MSNIDNGKILISTPKNNIELYYNTIIYVHHDTEDGAVGVMLNRPMDQEIAERFSQDIEWMYPEKMFLGGPLASRIGYVIHTNDYASTATVPVNDSLSYTNGTQIIFDINRGLGPSQFVLATGHCQWLPGQIDEEIASGLWIEVDYDEDYFFQNFNREDYWDYACHLAAMNTTNKLFETVDIT